MAPPVHELRQAYEVEGLALPILAERYGRSPGTVWGWLRKGGIATRTVAEAVARKPRAVKPDEVSEMVRLHAEGLSSNEIGARLSRDGRLVRDHLHAVGVLRSRGEAVELHHATRAPACRVDFFDRWSAEMAWVLGLIFGDGHVMNDSSRGQYGVSLAGTEQVTTAVSLHLGLSRGPRKAKGAECWILQWYSREIARSLKRFGLKGGSKATTMRFPRVPEAYLPHFIRGLWDADGSWSWTGRSPQAAYTSSSEGFIDDLRGYVGGRKGSWRSDKVKVGAVGYRLTLRVGEVRTLRDQLYKDSTDQTRCVRKYGIAMREEVAHPWA